jgi:hypothetical protein
MKRPSCQTCPYWDEKPMVCKRYAPGRSVSVADQNARDSHVMTTEDNWCGEHPLFDLWYSSTEQGKELKTAKTSMEGASIQALLSQMIDRE